MDRLELEMNTVDITKVTKVADIVKRTFTIPEIRECIYELNDYLKFLEEEE